ncbi:MAG: MarR family transcriptional regulator [Gammaproteobacteria bacterium]
MYKNDFLNRDRDTLRRSDSERQLFDCLRRIVRAADAYSRKLTAAAGISGSQLRCIKLLARRGSLHPGELAALMAVTPATVCGIVDRLESRGLLFRERQTADRRRVLITLSDAGVRMVAGAPPSLFDSIVQELRSLNEAELSELSRNLNRLDSILTRVDRAHDRRTNGQQSEGND